MTDDDTTTDDGATGGDGAAAETASGAEGTPEAATSTEVELAAAPRGLRRTTGGQTLMDRFITPVVLPVAAVAAIIFVVLNLSRALLAGTGGGAHEGAEAAAEGGGHAALPVVIAAVITIAILVFASVFAAAKQMRRHTLAVFGAVAMGVVMFAGWLSVGDAQEKVAEASTEPCSEPAGTLEIKAVSSSLTLDQAQYTAAAGCLELTYGGDTGHTLVFREPPPSPFPKFNGLGTETYVIPPGEYTVFCDVPGHDKTMHATLTVTGEGAPAEGAAAAE